MKLLCLNIIFLFLLLFVSCEESKFDVEAELYSLTVQINYPEHYSSIHAEAVEVTLVNVVNQRKSSTVTDVSGKATFEHIPAGEYNMVAAIQLSVEEAKELGDTLVNGYGFLGRGKGKP